MELEGGEFFVELGVIELAPVDEIEVFFWLEEREDFDPERGEDDVGVAGAAGRESGEEACHEEEGEWHPPEKGGMAHKGGDSDQEGEGKGDSGDHDESLSLTGTGETEFLVGFDDFLGSCHDLKFAGVDAEGVSLLDNTQTAAHGAASSAPPCEACALSKVFRTHGGSF